MLVALFGLGAIVLAALITLPTSKKAGIGSIVLFVVLSLAGALGAVVFAQHYHLPPSDKDKAAHTHHLISEWLEGQGAEIQDAPEAKDMLDGGADLWRLNIQGQELTLLCTPVDFPETAQLNCAEAQPLINEKIDVDFDDIASGH